MKKAEEVARAIVEKIIHDISKRGEFPDGLDAIPWPSNLRDKWVALVVPEVEDALRTVHSNNVLMLARDISPSMVCTCIAVQRLVPTDAPLEARVPQTQIVTCGYHRSLEARAQAAEAERDEAIDRIKGQHELVLELRKERDELRAEVERLTLACANAVPMAALQAEEAESERLSRRVEELEAKGTALLPFLPVLNDAPQYRHSVHAQAVAAFRTLLIPQPAPQPSEPHAEWADSDRCLKHAHPSPEERRIGDPMRIGNPMLARMTEEPHTPLTPCCICGDPVCTYEYGECPDRREDHKNGAELTDGRWTCSEPCFEKALEASEPPTPICVSCGEVVTYHAPGCAGRVGHQPNCNGPDIDCPCEPSEPAPPTTPFHGCEVCDGDDHCTCPGRSCLCSVCRPAPSKTTEEPDPGDVSIAGGGCPHFIQSPAGGRVRCGNPLPCPAHPTAETKK